MSQAQYYFYLLKPNNKPKENLTLADYMDQLSESEKVIVNKHFEYMNELKSLDKILIGGPFLDAKGLMLILKTSSALEAQELMAKEPTVRDGLFTITEHHPFQIGVKS